MVQVGRLDRLVNLNLNQSEVTDASLAHLKGLTNLHGLWAATIERGETPSFGLWV
jgi:hypothetical protein